MAETTPGRLLRLLSLLETRREWSGTELADRLDVTVRTVRRDMVRLRELGYPVAASTGVAGGYRLASGRDLPPLLLDDEEAVAVAVGLTTATGVAGIEESALRALAKLQHVLPTRLRSRVAVVGEVTTAVPRRGGPRVDPATLGVLATACRDRELVRLRYRTRGAAESSRRVEPHGLVVSHGLWYLVAYDTERAGWRRFRVDRVAEPASLRHRFGPRPPPAADLAAYVAAGITEAEYRYTATVTVDVPAETALARLRDPLPSRVRPVDAASCRVRLGADSADAVVTDLVALGAPFTVEDACPQVREHLRTVAARLAP